MVLTATRDAAVPTLVIPDEQSWTIWGSDPAGAAMRPVLDVAEARRVLVPERVPPALADSLAGWLDMVDADASIETRPAPISGDVSVASLRRHGGDAERPMRHEVHGHPGDEHGGDHGHHGDDGDGGEHGHGGGDHGDMMAITGDPSADGLVMEPIDFQLGPLGSPLPGGLVVDVTLDGDVVAESSVRALLAGTAPVPDLLAPAGWQATVAAARRPDTPWRERWTRVAEVERERTVSHLAWLRAFGRLLGWEELVERCSDALSGEHAVGRVASLLESSRLLAWRTAGRGVLDAERIRELGVRGPAARAAGIPDDARVLDPLYRRLGFEPLVHSDGDALARTLLRAREAAQSSELATAAMRMAEADAPADGAEAPGQGALVEGPRGPLHAESVNGELRLTAPGAAAALAAAGHSMHGEEWAAALVALASFDLSPWRVEG